MKERVLDTNIIVRYLVKDHQKHEKAARALFQDSEKGQAKLMLLSAVLAECVFVLESFYKHSRENISRVLQEFILSPGIELADTAVHLDALARYRVSGGIHFIDCLVAAFAVSHRMAVASFDQGFRKFSDVRLEVD